MKWFLNLYSKKNNIILSSISIILLSGIITLFIIVLKHTFAEWIARNNTYQWHANVLLLVLKDWFTYWSEWSVTFAFFVSIFLVIYHTLLIQKVLFFKNMKLGFIKTIFYLKFFTMIYLIITLVIYNGELIVNPTSIINNPDSLQSLLEHMIIPILYIIYFVINLNLIFFETKVKRTIIKKIIFIIAAAAIYPYFYLNYIFITSILPGFGFPYPQLDFTVIGWPQVLKNCLFLLIFFISISSAIYSTLFINNYYKFQKDIIGSKTKYYLYSQKTIIENI